MEKSIFFNSAPGDPRKYQASNFAEYFGTVLSTGLIHTDNVPALEVHCDGTDLRTYVNAGKAIMDGYLYENTTDLYLTHALPEASLDRIDRIVLRLDKRNQSRFIRLFVVQGVSSATPVAPTLQRDEFIYELCLAEIRVRANTSTLVPSDLIDTRLNEALCGLAHSLISIPTSQFQREWTEFLEGIQDEGFATTDYVNTKVGEGLDYAQTYVDDKPWQKHKLTNDQGTCISLPPGSDLNDIVTNGYFNGSGLLNAPTPGAAEWFYIESIIFTNSPLAYRTQRATALGAVPVTTRPKVYVRTMYSGAWSAWESVITSGGGDMLGSLALKNAYAALYSQIPGQHTWGHHNSSNGKYYISPDLTGGVGLDYGKGINISEDNLFWPGGDLNSLKQSGVDAKNGAVASLNAMGVASTSADIWATIHSKIRQISRNTRVAFGTLFADQWYGSSTVIRSITNLAFVPKAIVIEVTVEVTAVIGNAITKMTSTGRIFGLIPALDSPSWMPVALDFEVGGNTKRSYADIQYITWGANSIQFALNTITSENARFSFGRYYVIGGAV